MRNNHSCAFMHQRRSYSGVRARFSMYYAGIQWPPYPRREQCVIGRNRSRPVATLDEEVVTSGSAAGGRFVDTFRGSESPVRAP